jgi:D-3-phosphoglycerate dehydrogenase / 2-oxoglutarate reductase
MSQIAKHIFYYHHLNHPVYLELMGKRGDVNVVKVDAATPAGTMNEVLAAAHAYQIGSDQNEMPPDYQACDALFRRAPNLLMVSTHGAGYDTIDLEACTKAGILAMNQAGGNAEAVGEHLLGMMLCLSKRIIETDRFMRREAGIKRVEFMGHDLLGKTVGVVGMGHTGARIAELCRAAFGMRVLACDPHLGAEEIKKKGAEKTSLDTVFREGDYVLVCCPLSAETRGMVGATQYALMKPGAFFITCARGGIHDESALADALRSKKIAGAGLDVWDPEPPLPTHPLMQFDNVLVSPHTAGVTHESRIKITTIAVEQLLGAFDGKRPPRLLNPEAWDFFCKRYEKIFGRVPEPA